MNEISYFPTQVPAGFPCPSSDCIESVLNVHELLVKHPEATFFIRVEGDSMEHVMHSGDLLVIDRAIKARSGHIVLALLNGEFTIKKLWMKEGSVQLVAENPRYAPIAISKEMQFEVWGVVTYVIHACPR